ncbi:MAG TPA: helix-turn-helix transcriptional regulator [Hyphomonadaceae bacterium]|jgi:transcriptional regulator with XRE-family HTH domain|nr:helix-turn-helix transcriptional regulator [Hyphomonadaceae bacterium]HPI47513.1 helix-turn-helix transcriptional regulator [Hyphomonadaceae bacterium]
MAGTTRDPTIVDVTVGERLRKRREALEISQDDLAQGLGITYQQLQKYERGDNRISAGRLYDASRILKTSIAFFFEGLDPLHAAVRRGVAEEGEAFSGPEDSQLVELVLAVKQVKDPATRNSLVAMVKKQAKAAKKPAVKSRK